MPVVLFGLCLIAGFILLVVAINFLNLTSALSLARSGEVALRTTHIAFSWWVVAVSGTLALLIALLTVSFQSIRAAVANPVDILRAE